MRKKLSLILLIPVIGLIILANKHQNTNEIPKDVNITKLEVFKFQRKLLVYYSAPLSKKETFKIFSFSLGRNPIGKKMKAGDYRTPEGHYKIIAKNPKSSYFLSLKISYPNEEDLKQAKMHKTDPGKDIMVHGLKNGLGWLGNLHLLLDWTKGCIALNNNNMQEIYNHVEIGTPIYIYP